MIDFKCDSPHSNETSVKYVSFIRADEGNNSVFESPSILSVLVFIEVFCYYILLTILSVKYIND